MKKIISLVLTVLMVVTLFAGCGQKAEDNKITMATNAEFPPYEFMEDGKIVGIDAEIAQAIADKLGKELLSSLCTDCLLILFHLLKI